MCSIFYYYVSPKAQRVYVSLALESAHAIWGAVQLAKTLPKDQNIVMVSAPPLIWYWLRFDATMLMGLLLQCLSGRGDKDVEQISRLLPGKWADILDWHPNEMPKTDL